MQMEGYVLSRYSHTWSLLVLLACCVSCIPCLPICAICLCYDHTSNCTRVYTLNSNSSGCRMRPWNVEALHAANPACAELGVHISINWHKLPHSVRNGIYCRDKDTAVFSPAKEMFRGLGVELIGGELLLALNQPKVLCWHHEVHILLHHADRTCTVGTSMSRFR